MTDADKFSHCTFGWRMIRSIYTVRNKNAKFYSGLLICMTIKKHLNVDCIPFQSVQNLERGVYAVAVPLPHLVCYSFQVNPYSWLQSVLSDASARSTYSVALYLLLAGENWVSFKTFITTAIWQEILLKFVSVGIQTLESYRQFYSHLTWKTPFLLFDAQCSFPLNWCNYSKMILRLLGKAFEKEKDEKIGNEHFKVEIEICTALPIAEEHIVGDRPLAIMFPLPVHYSGLTFTALPVFCWG